MKTRGLWGAAFMVACGIEVPLLWNLSHVLKGDAHNLWDRGLVLYHAVIYGVLYAIDTWSGTPIHPGIFGSYPWLFYCMLFLLQSLLITPFVYLVMKLIAAIRSRGYALRQNKGHIRS